MTSQNSRIIAFTEETERAFRSYQADHPRQSCLTLDQYTAYRYWLLHPDVKAKGQHESNLKSRSKNFELHPHTSELLRKQPDGTLSLPVVNKYDVYFKIKDVHQSLGHPGRDKTWEEVQKRYSGIAKEDIAWMAKNCAICAINAASQAVAPLNPIKADNLFERIQVDLIDMRKEPDGQYKWILHIKDHFSKFTCLYPCKSKEASEVAHWMAIWIGQFGGSEKLQCDNGSEFKGMFRRS
jgi:hypothetical protein